MSVLFQFDASKEAVIEPSFFRSPIENFPPVAVSCFSSVLFRELLNSLSHRQIASVGLGSEDIPVYEVLYGGKRFAMYLSPVGAPQCVGIFEEMIVLGMQKLVLFGTCGVLDSSIADSSILIPNRAVRDEGTSYHYAPPADEIDVNVRSIPEFTGFLKSCGVSYTIGKVWTTDGFYRETPAKVAARKASGCIAVDMEASAMAAAAQFRDFPLLHFFYAADNLDAESYDVRSLHDFSALSAKSRIGALALSFAKAFSES